LRRSPAPWWHSPWSGKRQTSVASSSRSRSCCSQWCTPGGRHDRPPVPERLGGRRLGAGDEPDSQCLSRAAPELEPYFVTSGYDDDTGVLISAIARPRVTSPLQGFVAIPGVVGVLNSVVAGAVAGIAGLGLELGTGASIAIGAAAFLISLAGYVAYALRAITAYRQNLVVRFPTPPTAG
jgi:hypothetical protein